MSLLRKVKKVWLRFRVWCLKCDIILGAFLSADDKRLVDELIELDLLERRRQLDKN